MLHSLTNIRYPRITKLRYRMQNSSLRTEYRAFWEVLNGEELCEHHGISENRNSSENIISVPDMINSPEGDYNRSGSRRLSAPVFLLCRHTDVFRAPIIQRFEIL